MPRLQDLIPDVDTLLAIDPEDLGIALLQVMETKEKQHDRFHPGNYEGDLFPGHSSAVTAYPREQQETVLWAVREAFAWPNGQALIVPDRGTNGQNGWRVIGRRGKRLLKPGGWEEYRSASLLPKQLLHPRVRDKVYFNFQRGDYQTAVFVAFKEVEVAVREAAKLPPSLIGTTLMRRAFDKTSGPLADPNMEDSEREALAHLFAGAS